MSATPKRGDDAPDVTDLIREAKQILDGGAPGPSGFPTFPDLHRPTIRKALNAAAIEIVGLRLQLANARAAAKLAESAIRALRERASRGGR